MDYSLIGKRLDRLGPVAFMGDSIAEGYGIPSGDACWKAFEKMTGLPVISLENMNPVAYAGMGVKEFASRIDHLMSKWKPKTVFLSIGANNFDEKCRASYPFGISEDEISFFIKSILYCIRGYGAIPFWLGLMPFEECGEAQEEPGIFNSSMAGWLEKEGLPSMFFLDKVVSTDSWDAMGGDFYNNLVHDKHPNEAGHRLIAEFCAESMARFNNISL